MTDTVDSPHWTWTTPHWAVVLLMALVIPWLTRKTDKPGEFYPFSNYPMYSSFEPETYYVYVTDGTDKPLPMGVRFGVAASEVKKAFDRKLMEAKKAAGGKVRKADLPPEVQAAAGQAVLEWLQSVAPVAQREAVHALGTLRLHRVDVSFKDDALAKQKRQVAEVAVK
jgi:hypothetical protein